MDSGKTPSGSNISSVELLSRIDIILNLVVCVLFLLFGIPSILRSQAVQSLPTVPKFALLSCVAALYGVVAFGYLLAFHGEFWKWPFVYCILSILVSVVLFIFTRPR